MLARQASTMIRRGLIAVVAVGVVMAGLLVWTMILKSRAVEAQDLANQARQRSEAEREQLNLAVNESVMGVRRIIRGIPDDAEEVLRSNPMMMLAFRKYKQSAINPVQTIFLRKTINNFEEICKQHPGVQPLANGLAPMYRELGRVQVGSPDYAGALESFQKAVARHRDVVKKDPGTAAVLDELSHCYTDLAIALELNEDAAGVRAAEAQRAKLWVGVEPARERVAKAEELMSWSPGSTRPSLQRSSTGSSPRFVRPSRWGSTTRPG